MSTSNRGRGEIERAGANPDFNSFAYLFNRLHHALAVGTVTKADYVAGKVQVTFRGVGEENTMISHWLGWVTPRAHEVRSWVPYQVGEQVFCACPHGNMIGGMILGAINQATYPHEASDALRELRVFQSKTEGAFSEINRADWVKREYINEKGTYRVEIGPSQSTTEGAAFIMDAEHIQLRVKDTQLTVRDGAIRIQIKGQEVEQEWTEDKILAHVKSNAALIMEEKSISAELIAEEVRASLTEDKLRLMVKEALLEIMADKITQSVPGSRITADASQIEFLTLLAPFIQESAPPAVYEAGPETTVELIETKEPPSLAVGNAPSTPTAP